VASLRTVTVTERPLEVPSAAPEPQFRGPLESALRHPALVLIPVLLCLGAGIAIGLLRDDQHDAEARINVGRADVPAFTLQNVVNGNAVLAASYARLISAPPVIDATARAAGVTPDEARDALSASHIPGSTLIRVEAEADLKNRAIAIANDGAKALIAYVERLRGVDESTELLGVYERASKTAQRRRARVAELQARKRVPAEDLEQARAELSRSLLRLQRLSALYRNSGANPNLSTLVVANPAADTDSDRWETTGKLALIGLGVGLLIGLALALIAENRALIGRRRLA
jgi:hypothetical protein